MCSTRFLKCCYAVAKVFWIIFRGLFTQEKKNAPTSLEHCYAVTMVLCLFYCVMCLVGCRYIVRIL